MNKNERKDANKSQKKFRKTLVALLLMLSFVFTTGTFAYWATSVDGTSQEAVGTLTIGSADAVDTVFSITNELNSGGLLVPTRQLENSGLGVVDQIDLSYDVQWLEDEVESQLEGTQTVGLIRVSHTVEIEIDGEVLNARDHADVYDLITVEYDETNASYIVLEADATTFNFHITMDEPEDQAEYRLISEADITVTFTYEINDLDITISDVENILEIADGTVVAYFRITDSDFGFEQPVTIEEIVAMGFTVDSLVEAFIEGGIDAEGDVVAYFDVVDGISVPIYEDGDYSAIFGDY